MYQYSKTIEKQLETDVLVIGGGTAGFGAAVAAARNGAKTLLIEKNSMLGGMATSGLVGPFMSCFDNDGTEQIVRGIFDELCVRTEEQNGALHPAGIEGMTSYSSYYTRSHKHVTPFLSEILAIVMEDMVIEAGAEILYQAQVCDVIKEGNTIKNVVVMLKEGLTVITAKTFIDCTGDADVAYFAGLPTWYGDSETGIMQPTSLFFEVNGMDREKFVGALEAKKEKNELGEPSRNCWSWIVGEARANGDWHIGRNEVGNYEQSIPGRWKINTTRMTRIDATKSADITDALMDGRKQVQELMAFFRKYLPGCEDLQLLQVATSLGVRETRHIVGRYMLTVEDIMSRKHFDDAICTFGYAVDVHNTDGGGVDFQEVNDYYTIPFRCLVPVDCDNMLVAGRSICGTSEAAASYRVMPCCVALGQAAGTAAALALTAGVCPGDVEIASLRETLLAQDVVIKD